ncbi:hypothetical protein [Microvirga antarctica]|uniref:hypothetical protein n=1 Tax=Microvirga antarctica TaxID=2819233 RepID=UPI001B30C13A|nr:hypothetical protein [Microvirga antarctica]
MTTTLLKTQRNATKIALAVAVALTSFTTFAPSSAEAQYYPPGPPGPQGPPRYREDNRRPSRGLVCVVDPEYRRSRASCQVGGYGKQPGDYCECRLYNYGPTVPGVIR